MDTAIMDLTELMRKLGSTAQAIELDKIQIFTMRGFSFYLCLISV